MTPSPRFDTIQTERLLMRRLGLTEVARFDHPRVPADSPLRAHVTYHRRAPGLPGEVSSP